MKIERSNIVLHLKEEEKDVLECTRFFLIDLCLNMSKGDCIKCNGSKVTYEEIEKMLSVLDVILSNAAVD